MNILVCIKQVPDTTEIKIDPVKKAFQVSLILLTRAHWKWQYV